MPSGGERSIHAVCQVQRGLERTLLPATHDRIDDMLASPQGLSGILREDGHKAVLVKRIDQIRRSHSLALIITHVQKTVLLETEASACVVDVHAVKPEIQENPIRCGDPIYLLVIAST